MHSALWLPELGKNKTEIFKIEPETYLALVGEAFYMGS
jgi:hypothetical protein